MTVTEIKPNMLCLEYRQNETDEDYGSCLYARFYFNLDRYELTIISDCGNYGYKWYETPRSESFLELMARCDKGYMLDKLYGSADIFDYDETKKACYDCLICDEEDKEKLDSIFESFEWNYIPESGEYFLRLFDAENDDYFLDTWELVQYRYPSNALKIVSIFKEHIRPKIKEIVKEGGKNG